LEKEGGAGFVARTGLDFASVSSGDTIDDFRLLEFDRSAGIISGRSISMSLSTVMMGWRDSALFLSCSWFEGLETELDGRRFSPTSPSSSELV
jgi:hypothetical protein